MLTAIEACDPERWAFVGDGMFCGAITAAEFSLLQCCGLVSIGILLEGDEMFGGRAGVGWDDGPCGFAGDCSLGFDGDGAVELAVKKLGCKQCFKQTKKTMGGGGGGN